jgi:hypothetical protein
LNAAVGAPGSFCDHCGAPATRGFELRSPMTSSFYCVNCAGRVFGETETDRAMRNAVATLKASGLLRPDGKPPERRVPFFEGEGRPIGFIR